MPLSRARESFFPNLNPDEYIVTSEETSSYNCLAWAAEDNTRWWGVEDYWPESAPKVWTLESLETIFENIGYERCESADYELDFVKVAIFVDADEVPTHVARQLRSGNWTSKLGEWEDIEHKNPEGLAGTASIYGKVALVMKMAWEE